MPVSQRQRIPLVVTSTAVRSGGGLHGRSSYSHCREARLRHLLDPEWSSCLCSCGSIRIFPMNYENPPPYAGPGPSAPYPPYAQQPGGPGPNPYPGYPPGPAGYQPGPPGPPGQPGYQGYPQYGWQNNQPPAPMYMDAPKNTGFRSSTAVAVPGRKGLITSQSRIFPKLRNSLALVTTERIPMNFHEIPLFGKVIRSSTCDLANWTSETAFLVLSCKGHFISFPHPILKLEE
ncbi:cysteine-rich and transmembrane domain-containing protein 1 isoform X2 [Ascaphus truei]|uniref:cysteine-rich and transmembrane domain-containing protein 1 isoform X2 n=1 Tax=Ascaphus truei TaxID=8439 RepID=UPI003F5A4A3D